MNNLQKILELLLKRVSPQAIINKKIMYDSFPEAEFIRLAHSYMTYYSEDEIYNMWRYYKSNFEDQRARIYGFAQKSTENTINVFSVLASYCDEMLILKENQVLCHYHNLLAWRELSSTVGEDIFIANYMARGSEYMSMESIGFSWDVVTKHNNHRLYAILDRGISENHFHFWGSIPIFQLSWISLMNNVYDAKLVEYLKKYDQEKRYTNINYGINYEEKSLSVQYLQAAYIRIFLFSYLTDTKIEIGSYVVPYKQYANLVKLDLKNDKKFESFVTGFDNNEENSDHLKSLNKIFEEAKGKKSCFWLFREICFMHLHNDPEEKFHQFLKEDPKVCWILKKILTQTIVSEELHFWIEDVATALDFKAMVGLIEEMLLISNVKLGYLYDFIEKKQFDKIWHRKTFSNIEEILSNSILLFHYREKLQGIINGLNGNYTGESKIHKKWKLEDYILYAVKRKGENGSFSGENWFLYSMFKKINKSKTKDVEYFNLFYAYILLRENIRSEIVQVNKNVGFANFQKYQSRKGDLIHDEMFRDYDVQKALSYNLLKENIESLEVRITPPKSNYHMKKQIQDIDQLINPDKTEEKKGRYFFVYHFVREVDKVNINVNDYYNCRHENKRKEMEDRAKAIVSFRRNHPEYACRILGIDACSSEIGCRPEIFASAFRFLSSHVCNDSSKGDYEPLPQLRITYHAGEEFLDVADGLRAIDEAIIFFNMNCGDRLGHAIALGIDAEDWYNSKGNRILISKQDYLDNIAWLYGRIVELEIPGHEELKDYLHKKFSLYFKTIYEDNIEPQVIKEILQKMKKKYQDTYGKRVEEILPYGIENYNLKFDIYAYYTAWKLRGDDPEYYKKGYFNYNSLSMENDFEYYRINRQFPNNFETRYMPDVALLYYLYHYNSCVRQYGRKQIEVEVNSLYIEGVKAIQKRMQKIVEKRGISIETNPSSNYAISTFRNYAKHPIVEFYNRELEMDVEKLRECPQLCVSINTDDKGVFSTTLENEYSLMAKALEEMKDENGKTKYNREQIYSWLEKIREMGNIQSFQSKHSKKHEEGIKEKAMTNFNFFN